MEPTSRGGQPDRSANRPRLTPRQHQVLRLRALGRSNDEVAAELGIAVNTLHHHRTRIATKLGSSGILVDMLRAVGWLQVPA